MTQAIVFREIAAQRQKATAGQFLKGAPVKPSEGFFGTAGFERLARAASRIVDRRQRIVSESKTALLGLLFHRCAAATGIESGAFLVGLQEK